MLGFHRRRVRRWEWETAFPKPGLAPVTSQMRDMTQLYNENHFQQDGGVNVGTLTTREGLETLRGPSGEAAGHEHRG